MFRTSRTIPYLPTEPSGEADLALAPRAGNLHEVAISHTAVRISTRRSGASAALGASEMRSVRQVIELRTELELQLFTNRECATDTDISVFQIPGPYKLFRPDLPKAKAVVDWRESGRIVVMLTRSDGAETRNVCHHLFSCLQVAPVVV